MTPAEAIEALRVVLDEAAYHVEGYADNHCGNDRCSLCPKRAAEYERAQEALRVLREATERAACPDCGCTDCEGCP